MLLNGDPGGFVFLYPGAMQVRVDWVLPIFGTQAIKKKWPVRSVIPDYLSVSYDNALIKNLGIFNKQSCVTGSDVDFM